MVSMKDISAVCGVSVATVSKALNDQNDIGQETKRRIRKVAEEMGELQEAYAAVPKSANGKVSKDDQGAAVREVEAEFGDVLFSLVNVGRKMGLDAEAALRATCEKFRRRWAFMEAAAEGDLADMPQPQQEALWQEAKSQGL